MATTLRDGVSLYYEVHGDAAREPLLLLMGLGTDAHAWELQLPAFAARYRVVLVDNRGVGRSSKPAGPYTTAGLAADALAVLDAASIARAHVVGLSMGGMIAQELALARPDRVASLVLASTYARPGQETQATVERSSQSMPGMPSPLALFAGGAASFDMANLGHIDMAEVFQFLMPLVFSPRFLVEKREFLQQMFMRSLGYGFSLPAFLGQVAAVMSHDTASRLPSLRASTLVLTGTDDRLVPPHHSDELARLIPGARLVRIEGGTHGLNFEHPEALSAAVLGFLSENPIS